VITSTCLGRHVVGRPAERAGTAVVADVLLTHPEVGHFDVSVTVQQHVVQLQVPAESHTHTHTPSVSRVYFKEFLDSRTLYTPLPPLPSP